MPLFRPTSTHPDTAGTRRPRRADARRIAAILRQESVGGALVAASAVAALVLANTPAAHLYLAVRDFTVGPSRFGLHLTLGEWAGEGLLAIFFFVAGLELKHEFMAGDLRDVRRAAVPVAAAVGGMVLPALLYVAINLADPSALVGWAIPTATDIAFALAVLAVVGRHLPGTVRTFLLTLAVVDDLLAIVVIALFYSHEVSVLYLVIALLPAALFGVVVRLRPGWWWALIPLAVLCWGLMHASGVHATVAGVVLALTVPVAARGRTDQVDPSGAPDPAEPSSRAPSEAGVDERLDHVLRPISAGVAVPIFAFLSAGVGLGGWSGLTTALHSRVVLGILVGMVVGKAVGIFVSATAAARILRSPLRRELTRADLFGTAVLGGVGFTVSLLIGELAFGAGGQRQQEVRIAVLAASLTAAVLSAVVVGIRNRRYRAAGRRADPRGSAV